jgi:hypothetical protein
MRRFIRSSRTRKNVINTSQLRDDFIRQLARESEALLQQLSAQFSQDLQAQVTQTFQGIIAQNGPVNGVTPNPEAGSIGGVGQLLSTGVRLLLSRPKTSRSTRESARSIAAGAQLRLSAGQAAAEAQISLSRGDKNL